MPIVAPQEAESELTFSASVQAWCSEHDDPLADDGEMYLRVGIDPTGGEDAWADSVVWSEWKRGTNEHRELVVAATARSDTVTVFVRAWNKWKLSHNDVYVDAAKQTVAGMDAPPELETPELAEISAKLDRLVALAERIADRLDQAHA